MHIRFEVPYIPDVASGLWQGFRLVADPIFTRYKESIMRIAVALGMIAIFGFAVDRFGLLGTLGLFLTLSVTVCVLLVGLLTGRFWLPGWALRMIEKLNDLLAQSFRKHFKTPPSRSRGRVSKQQP